jgi:5S rRNA maturation endonuclease (ribonuclease M5)
MPKTSGKNRMWPWFVHGVNEGGKWTSDDKEYFTECLWCLAPGKLYINPAEGKGMFQCKVCPKQGNYFTFLKEVHELNKAAIKEYHFEALATERGLPVDAFKGHGLGWNGSAYTLPVLDINKKMVGLKFFKPGEKMMSSPGTKVELFKSHRLLKHMHGPIIVTEGEWDTIAMSWLVKELKVQATVVGVPGAHINVARWEQYFYDKNVITLYDNDNAGIEGEFKLYQQLHTKAKSIRFIHWPEVKPNGYDVRDLIKKYSVEPDKAFNLIEKWLQEFPRKLQNYATKDRRSGKLHLELRKEKLEPITFNELIAQYQDYLYMPNIDPIKVMLASIFANRFKSEMVWLFLVAPPSSSKSELITSLFGSPEIEAVSKITEHTLVSGFIQAGGIDASLIVKLRDRILAVKDFTPILGMAPIKQEEIFGTFRDAYDGQLDFMYGHAQHRRYKDIRFGMIAGVTAAVESFGRMQQTLGERFLRYYLPIDISPVEERKRSMRAMSNIGHEKEKKDKLKEAVHRFLQTHQGGMPVMSQAVREQIYAIGHFTAAMRGIVPRDWKERVQYHPSVEGSTRVTKQLSLMGFGLACLSKKEKIDEEDIKLVKEIALSTCPDLVKTTIKTLNDAGKHLLMQKDLEEITGFPVSTLKYVLDDLKMLGLVKRLGYGFRQLFTLSEYSKELISLGNIYAKPKLRFRINSSGAA